VIPEELCFFLEEISLYDMLAPRNEAVASHDPGLSDIVSENLFHATHSDPRWLPFLRKFGLAPEQLANIQFKVTLPP
jgi:hypothetical protein